MFLVAAYDVSFRKIMKVYLVTTTLFFIITILAVKMGLIIDLIFPGSGGGEHQRESFGFSYPTYVSAHLLGMMLSFYYLYHSVLKWWTYIAGIGATAILFYFSRTRTGCICLLFLNAGCLILCLFEMNRKKLCDNYHEKKASHFECFFMPITAIITYLVSVMYDETNPTYAQLNLWLSNRLSLTRAGLINYGISLFGNPVKLIGFGGSLKSLSVKGYNFVDSFYINSAIKLGIIFVLLVLILHVIACYKYRDDRWFILCIMTIALKDMVEIHNAELLAIIFIYAVIAKRDSDVKKSAYIIQ